MTSSKQFQGFIGTYTKGGSEGIYSFALDSGTGTVSGLKLAAKLDNPTYLTVSQDNQFLYAVAKEGESGGVAAYRILEDGSLEPINSAVSEGAPPCHVSVGSGTGVLAANYHKGTIEHYPLNEDGSIQPPSSIAKHEGSGPDPRQEKAHSHFAGNTPDGKYVIAVELGIDQVITYKLDNGQLSKAAVLNTKPGSGPRHLVFHPSQPFAYVMTEFSSEVLVLEYSSEDGSFEQIQNISTLPDTFTKNNQGSAIHISSDGKFIYAGNRGHDSLAIFRVDPDTCKLRLVERVSTEGNWPRDFVLDPSEKFLVASNQNSSNLVVYSRDKETGKLTLLQSDISVHDPVCVKFLHY
ncbi:6-phosphogluconolactonase [Mesobacillus campisalis]|uniref:6-phosphogluconolactonase n=1 Tax=Mesobacillus campisalis TaxID=1408103 RepID=A0A0M2SXH9_9BACI|nr:lactonase family protein [Mesobacillus campisalis]KKK39284.1 6-phosphogluconolactonase [Mesobacillus campisalis]